MQPIVRFVVFAAALALLAGNAAIALAHQDATPAAGTADHPVLDPRLEGYPEFHILMTDSAISVPPTATAGRTLIIEENDGSNDGHVFILRVPDEVVEEEIVAALASAETPDWFFSGHFTGNPDRAAPGETSKAGLVDLVSGRYIVIDPVHPKEPARFEVLDTAAPATPPDPAGDVLVEMLEMSFTVPAEVPAGQSVWQVTNGGVIPHEIALSPVPTGATGADILAAMTALLSGQPVPAGLGAAWESWNAPLVDGVGVTSPGGTVWAQFDLAPGTYAALCFFPGANGPHLMDGMIQVITVI